MTLFLECKELNQFCFLTFLKFSHVTIFLPGVDAISRNQKKSTSKLGLIFDFECDEKSLQLQLEIFKSGNKSITAIHENDVTKVESGQFVSGITCDCSKVK